MFGQIGCNWAKLIVFGHFGCIHGKWLYSREVAVFGPSGYIRAMWFYLGKSCSIRAKWLNLG